MKKIVLIDGNSLLNRAYYATPPLTDKKGMPTNAVFAFVNMLTKLIHDLRPEYIAVAFDLKAPTFRHKMYDGYKATRKPMPDDLAVQLPVIKDLLAKMNICILQKEGFEADDIIGTIAKRFDIYTCVVTGDKDSFQLVDEHTCVRYTKRGVSDVEEYNVENFQEKTGITPAQIVDLKALMGDSSDNIPGVKGIGEKTAKNLLQKYGTIQNLYQTLNGETPSVTEKLVNGKVSALLSYTLATIDVHAPIEATLEQMTCHFPFPAVARQKMSELDFRILVKKEEWFEEETKTASKDEPSEIPIQTVLSVKEFADVVRGKDFSFAMLQDGFYAYVNQEYRLPIKQTLLDEGVMEDEALLGLQDVFENKMQTVTIFHGKNFAHRLHEYGIALRCCIHDVSIMKYVADYVSKEESFEEVLSDYALNKKTPAFSLLQARSILEKKMEDEGLTHLYREIELPLSRVLFDMEIEGFRVDEQMLRETGKTYAERLKELTAAIYQLAGVEFNVNSTKQLGEILFDKLGLVGAKKTKRGLSTSADVLESLQDEHPIVPLVLRYRGLQKLVSTYVDGLLPLIRRQTGRIHTSFNQLVTTTGRLSSKEPNLQNIPVRDEEGREIRKFFIARDDEHVLVDADYSQIELRLLAHFSGSEKLVEAFRDGKDIHTLTASQVFDVAERDVTSEMRRSAKAVNFGIIYGISDFGLGKNLKISSKRAGEYIRKYFESYPGVKEYMEQNIAFAKANGYVKTLLGRKRVIRELSSSNYNVRAFGERAAMNMPLQGTSADIIKIAMIRVAKRLKEEGLRSKLILQVHDELIVDALKSERKQVETILKEEMEGAVTLSVPLTVDVSSGKNWYEAH